MRVTGSELVGLLPALIGRAAGASDFAIGLLQITVALLAALLLELRLKNREFLKN